MGFPMTLDDALRAALRAGCTGVTLWPAGTSWQANVRQAGGGWRVCTDQDPIAALRGACGAPAVSEITNDNGNQKGDIFG